MTIEQANAAALKASREGDLGALKLALQDRRGAIKELLQSAPSVELAARVRNAISAGEFVKEDMRGIKASIVHIDLRG